MAGWNAGSGALERTLKIEEARPWSLAFSPDSATLVVGGQKGNGSGELTVWDVGSGKLNHRLERSRFVITTAISANGKRIASGGGGGDVRSEERRVGKECRL